MELQQLRLFIAAADTGSFTRGAERAFVSQPALSASISKLEKELGTRLFVRNKRQVVLTPAGRKLLKRAKSIVGECAKAREELRQHDVQRHLRLGVINTLSIVWVARLIEQYRQANPDLQLDVIDASEEDMARLQRDGHVDLALTVLGVVPAATATITPLSGMEMRELFREPYVVAMLPECHLSRSPSISIRDLDKEPFIARSHCEHRPVMQGLLKQHGVRLNLAYVTNQDDRALALVKEGVGISILPHHYVPHPLVAVPLQEDSSQRVVGFQWQPGERQQEVDRLVEFATTLPWNRAA